MNYHLYFHDDFDGMASAAVLLDFFKGLGDGVASFNPLDYEPGLKDGWAKRIFKQPSVTVDFLYHPDFTWWFDHHETSFINKAWRDNYKNDMTRYFNSRHKSCVGAVLFHLKNMYKYNPPRFIKELAAAADIIDSAGYKSAAELVELKRPAATLALILDTLHPENKSKDSAFSASIIRLFSKKSIGGILNLPRFKKGLALLKKELKKAKDGFKNFSEIRGNTILIKPTESLPILQFIGYYLHPKINFSVRIGFDKEDKIFRLSVSKNPWGPDSDVHIGRILAKYGGGGHKGAGGYERKSKREIMKIAEKVIEYLNKHG